MPPPEVHDKYSLIAYCVLLAFGAFQMWQNRQIQSTGDEIKKQTNGLVTSTVKSAGEAGHAQGELVGANKEQIRTAAMLALAAEVAAAKLALAEEVAAAKTEIANEAAAHLERIKQGQHDPLYIAK
jgi:hypothetical protein